MPSGSEWIIVLVVVLVLFGGSQLPKLARNLGKAQKEFKDGLSQGEREAQEAEAARADAARAETARLDAARRAEPGAVTPTGDVTRDAGDQR
ncbi:MAG: twin-arginine translocase TatA/TatE family subunit [Geodermatophilaceae bacterium]|nr:twin-arginine translocase TatA/TatE family subunit [Geodermatophilaceae bacterium]MBA3604738.1 twin-arginine translocase TatA/TatE family subunit [Acidimicrobiia bacterium]